MNVLHNQINTALHTNHVHHPTNKHLSLLLLQLHTLYVTHRSLLCETPAYLFVSFYLITEGDLFITASDQLQHSCHAAGLQ